MMQVPGLTSRPFQIEGCNEMESSWTEIFKENETPDYFLAMMIR